MKWEGGRRSTNIEDRRGLGAGTIGGAQRGIHRLHSPIAEEHVRSSIPPDRRVDHPPALQEDVSLRRHLSAPAAEDLADSASSGRPPASR